MKKFNYSYLLLLVLVQFLLQAGGLCLEKYKVIPGHTACLPPSPLFIPTSYESKLSIANKRIILQFHNAARRIVKPPAADMQKMYWSEDLASMAQAWAEQCKGYQESNIQRSEPGKYTAGQNLSWNYKSWRDVLQGWFVEHSDFVLGKGRTDSNSNATIGHYVQMVYATAAKVGCGQAQCRGLGVMYVCNYAGSVNKPVQPYTSTTTPCSACPNHCSNALCDFGGKVCFNGGSLDLKTGKCNCLKQEHEPGNCELRCRSVTDHPLCASLKDKCFHSVNMPYQCPCTCKVCPSGGIDYSTKDQFQGCKQQ